MLLLGSRRAMDVQVHIEVDRPVDDVWRFYAVEHVRNHPRWDSDMHLEQLSDGPIGLGTSIRRVNTRWDTPVEGEMEVVEFDQSAPSPSRSTTGTWTPRASRSRRGDRRGPSLRSDRIEGMDDPEKLEFLTRMMQRSVDNVKRLIETEIAPADE